MANERQIAEDRSLSMAQVMEMKRTRGLSNESLLAMPERGLRSLLRKLSVTDRPRAREALLRSQRMNDDGKMVDGAMDRALKQLDSCRHRAAARPRTAGVPTGRQVEARMLRGPMAQPAAGLGTGQADWVALGPGNIGGRTRSLVIHPQTPQIMWAGSVGGGVWLSEDAGLSWNPVDDQMANLAVACMAMDPANPDVLYAGTGEGFSNLDAIRGAGIFRTTDGTNWTQLTATGGTSPTWQFVNRLAVSSDGRILHAATQAGILFSDDVDRQNWVHAFDQTSIADLKIDPTNDQHLVAGGLTNGNAYVSNDGGVSWQEAQHDEPWDGRVELAISAQNPQIIYASVQMTSGEIWRSTDGGETYERRNATAPDGDPAPFLGEQGWYDNVIWAGDPTDSDLVLVGGVDLWRSTDGGDSLIDISTWWSSDSVHADHHAIVAHPEFDGVNELSVFFGNDGGVYMTDDIRTAGDDADPPRVSGWRELVNTYAVTQFYGVAGNAQSGTIVGGAQDNGSLAFFPHQGSEAWGSFFGGDGGFVAADPNDPQVFYGEYVFLNIHRNLDGATTDDTQGNRYLSGQFYNFNLPQPDWDWKPLPFRIPDARNQDALFIAPFVLDPNEPNRILGGGRSLWRTNDAKTPNTDTSGPSWASIKSPIGQWISAIAVAPGDSDRIWVGYERGPVFRAQNGTATFPTWQRMDNVGLQALRPRRFCTRVVIDPENLGTVYVMYGGYEADNVWKTTDNGATWVDIATSIPDVPVRTLAIHPRISNFLYLGTEVGVFTSENAGATWSPTNEGPTNCSVYELCWMDETLVCATHGRGMFQVDLSHL